MKECTFRKIQCNAGHFSKVFSINEIMPKRCPICNQPYDRRYNRPIACYEDGSVPEEREQVFENNRPEQPRYENNYVEQQLLQGNMQNNRSEQSLYENNYIQEQILQENIQNNSSKQPLYENGYKEQSQLYTENIISKESVQRNETNVLSENGFIKRGRQLSQQSNSDERMMSSKRRIAEESNPFLFQQSGYTSVNMQQRTSPMKKIVLFTGGYKIEIPSSGGYLGREGIGKECFRMNPLISRKHAFVKVDHFGNLQVRDENSLNGTSVDDGMGRRQLNPQELAMLKVGDTIWIANQILVVKEGAI
ncbi:MAG: FHA domain-containing protein [Lachnospiraceae bacterium]|nr:FHA domain-containing protein [Lachnospiraceae bacterium]